MTTFKSLLRGTTLAAALAVALPLLHSEPARALPIDGCYTDLTTECVHCHFATSSIICFQSICEGWQQETCVET